MKFFVCLPICLLIISCDGSKQGVIPKDPIKELKLCSSEEDKSVKEFLSNYGKSKKVSFIEEFAFNPSIKKGKNVKVDVTALRTYEGFAADVNERLTK